MLPGKIPPLQIDFILKADSLERVRLRLSSHFSFRIEGATSSVTTLLEQWVDEYRQGRWTSFPLFQWGSSFRDKVLQYLLTIASGTAESYKTVAEAVGHPGAARAVGNVCRSNPFPLLIPCHRVIHSNGSLGHYTPDKSIKEHLLQFEGFLPAS